MTNIVGMRIKEKRLELGLSQIELARKMGYKNRTSVCKAELGLENMTTERVNRFAQALNCTPADLMGWTTPQNQNFDLESYLSMILAYRNAPEKDQKAICMILGIPHKK